MNILRTQVEFRLWQQSSNRSLAICRLNKKTSFFHFPSIAARPWNLNRFFKKNVSGKATFSNPQLPVEWNNLESRADVFMGKIRGNTYYHLWAHKMKFSWTFFSAVICLIKISMFFFNVFCVFCKILIQHELGVVFPSCVFWLSTGVMIIPTRTMHYHQGNPFALFDSPKNGYLNDPCFSTSKNIRFSKCQVLHKFFLQDLQHRHVVHIILQGKSALRAERFESNQCFMVSPFASMTSHAWNAGWGWMMRPLFLAKTTFLTNIVSELAPENWWVLEDILLMEGILRSPPGMYKTLEMMGYLPYQLVQDFCHQPYLFLFVDGFLTGPMLV